MKYRSPWGLILVVSGCGDGAVPPTEPIEPEASCTQQIVGLEGRLNAVLPELGFRPREVLDILVGQHSAALAWKEAPYTYAPGASESEILIEVSALEPPHVVKRIRQSGSSLLDSECSTSLELPVVLTLRTADGVLDERVETVVVARTGDLVIAELQLEVAELSGSFETSPPGRGSFSVAPLLAIGLRFSAGGATGEMSLVSNFVESDGQLIVRGTTPNLAEFPAQEYCGSQAFSVPSNKLPEALSIERVLEQLNAGFPVQLFESNVMLSAEFSSAVSHVCLPSFPGSAHSDPRFIGNVALQASDGSVQGSVEVSMNASQIGYEVGAEKYAYMAQASGRTENLEKGTELARSFGIEFPIDFSGYQGAHFSWVFQSASGFLDRALCGSGSHDPRVCLEPHVG